jgi:ABC-2 type transport system permease protein
MPSDPSPSFPSSDSFVLRSFGRFNARGFATLLWKEIYRFLKVYPQTVLAPVVAALLFFTTFSFAHPESHGPMQAGGAVGGVSYSVFLASGLVMMTIIQNAFFNTSGSLILSKLQGNIVDLVMAPLSPFEWVLAYGLGGVARGLFVGLLTLAVLALVTDLPLLSPLFALIYAVGASLLMSILGFIVGLWGDSFDHIGTVQNFIIMPATFLSGTFFSIAILPPPWGLVSRMNPFFYMIDGFRFGFTGVTEGSLLFGLAFIALMNVVLFWIAYKMVASGMKLKN